MILQERIDAFSRLGKRVEAGLINNVYEPELIAAENANGWFTLENTRPALSAIAEKFLDRRKISEWLSSYTIVEPPKPVKIAIVMAGNVPLAGWHDVMCVLLLGHKVLIKSSSKDDVLIKLLLDELIDIEVRFHNFIEFAVRMEIFDAVIATGSNNTFRYFEYYFGKYPHLLRKNRNSVAVLSADQPVEDLNALGSDIFSYFGLGCRNVSKMYVPEGYSFTKFFDSIENFFYVENHNKYKNNYDYNKSIFLLNKEIHFDNGFLLARESAWLSSPMACIHYEFYSTERQLRETLESLKEDIQCIVGDTGLISDAISFGTTQQPELWDYADRVDTITKIQEMAKA
ncbi:MAG: acyl-CoA reductase [Bacteroidota bacterium]|nr:acyl-CoA reductase [Bacteroidota bacterium]